MIKHCAAIRAKALLVGALLLMVLPTMAQVSKMESEYLRLAALYEQRPSGLHKSLRQYLKDYPYTTYEDEVLFMEGVMLVERGQYKNALKSFDMVDFKALGRAHQPEYQFYRGYAYLMMQEYHKAESLFSILRKGSSAYQSKGAYYYAYCLYKQEQYAKALPVLLTLENQAQYRKTVPYFIVQIYYYQSDYDEVRTRAEQLMREQPEGENNGEISRILGEIYYRDGRYEEAAASLSKYRSYYQREKQEPVRADQYLLGMSQYRMGRYEEAVRTFKAIRQLSDTLSESACLTMGHSYVKLRQPEQAKWAYQAAMKVGITPSVREEAMYNYALCCYHSSTALGESVTAFTDFLNEYPNSRYEEAVFQLMSEAFLRSKNYAAALQALDALTKPGRKILETKQFLRYQLGADAFVQGNMKQARELLTEVIRYAQGNDRYLTEAYYLRAEACYRLRDFAAAAQDVENFFRRSDAAKSPNVQKAQYLKGYICFSQKRYEVAEKAFERFLEREEPGTVIYADAVNRLGDCAFNARRFSDATGRYSSVVAMRVGGSDYATFQLGYVQGLQRKYREKEQTMWQLVERYPKSDYADDGLYEAARAEIEMEHQDDAVATYSELLKRYPNSVLCRKASVEQAMLYRNMGRTADAIAAYKMTIQHYPSSEEAYTALEGLEAIYVETNRIGEYLSYTKQLGRLNMSVATKEDSLSYAAAELQYMLGNYPEAAAGLTTYLSQYCSGGRYCTVAQYYCADSYYRLHRSKEALQAYRALSEIEGNPYMEEACTRVAELCYDAADYATAMEFFFRILNLASSNETKDMARLGILRCSSQLARHQTTIDVATEILNDENTQEAVRNEARYNRAKAYVSLQQYGPAIVDLEPCSADVRTASGAESKYLLADCYYRLKDLDDAEKVIMTFAQQQTQHQYWLAKALILLSDINVDRGDTFLAQQYLLTLQRNYTATDDIQSIVSEKLNVLNHDEE